MGTCPHIIYIYKREVLCMDEIIKTKNAPSSNFYKICFVCLILLAGVSAIVASNITDSYTEITKLSYYNRYHGNGDSITISRAIIHFFDAVSNSLPTLVQLIVLFILSFSPFLIPASAIVTAFRGFVIGCALHCARDISGVLQLSSYMLCVVVICFMSALCLRKDLGVSKKVFLFFISSGICVTSEFVLSFIL